MRTSRFASRIRCQEHQPAKCVSRCVGKGARHTLQLLRYRWNEPNVLRFCLQDFCFLVSDFSLTTTVFTSMSSSEEKLDDFLQEIADQELSLKSSDGQNPFARLSSKTDDQSYYLLLRELAVLLTEKNTEIQKEQPTKKKKIEISSEAERLLRDAATVFSDTRPPADFVVYQDGTVSAEGQRSDSNRPPIFDGSVANATPPPLGGPGNGSFGGAGTILHLACALDVPLALAFVLAMGADARATHTAFRRLMIHEAACNGSLNCLTLLLELGQKFAEKDAKNGDGKKPARTGGLDLDLPFLPRRIDRMEAIAPLQMYVRHTAGLFGRKSSSSEATAPMDRGNDFLSVLRIFRDYSKQVKDGTISELDAARKVLEYASLNEESRNSLARSCGFISEVSPAVTRSFLRPQGGSLDGHGNTPLHWAAFKNEIECVALLLQYKADPNARAHPSGWTPLHDAAYSNSRETIELLLDAGASVDARANSGATPLCFAAQEDAADAAWLLLDRGADLTIRCAGGPVRDDGTVNGPHSRFSGYTPLHYCAHYNAEKAARVLLQHPSSKRAMEIADLSERLPIHVAVARGSSDVLRELLHAGARVETRMDPKASISTRSTASLSIRSSQSSIASEPSTPTRSANPPSPERRASTPRSRSRSSTPVSSPILRSMIPAQPVTSSKPWNCLTQRSIDECRQLISEAERSWAPDRHSLFTPADRQAVVVLLKIGKRLEQQGTLFYDMWPHVLSFCGRGWFEVEDEAMPDAVDTSMSSQESSSDDSLALPNF